MVGRDAAIAVYVMASGRNGTLYVGVTSQLEQRVASHKQALIAGFTKRYGCRLLVWFEMHDDMLVAIAREKQLKKWLRAWKVALIERDNPQWLDLAADWWNDDWTAVELPSLINSVILGRSEAEARGPRSSGSTVAASLVVCAFLGPRVAPAERPRMTGFKNLGERDPTHRNLSPM